MSRSFGDTSLTTRPPILTVPPEMSSRPATMRSAVVLPQPDGPTSTRNSPSWMSSVRSKTAWTPLSYTLSTSSNTTSAMDPPDLELRGIVERFEGLEGKRKRPRDTRSGHEQALVAGLADEHDRVVVDVHEAQRPAGERAGRAAQRDQRAHLAEELLVPLLPPRHRAARVLAPLALEPELVAREQHRHARQGHLE